MSSQKGAKKMIDKAKINRDALLEKYAANLSSSRNKAHYLSYARDFLDHADALDRASIDRYLTTLRKKGRVPGTINFVFRVMRRLFTVNGLEWGYHRGEAPAIGERDEYRPQLSTEIIERMIRTATSGRLTEDEACFLALSTIYGVRREEMVILESKDIDLKTTSIFISTVKYGRQRYHLIPEEIKPYLKRRDFNQRYSATAISQVFWRIVNKSNLEGLKSARLGWHAIRRAVLDGLINNNVNPFAARAFLRWKGIVGDLAMPTKYYGNVVVGLDGTTPVLEEAKGDEDIFEKHPFLPMWRVSIP